MPVTVEKQVGSGRVRSAHLADTPQLTKLFARTGRAELARLGLAEVGSWLDHGHLLVLDDAGTLIAAAVIDEREGRGQIELLVVEPTRRGIGIEQRMLGVIDALCRAFGRQVSLALPRS
jgi:GNAT superfamily N-acetyltransferase